MTKFIFSFFCFFFLFSLKAQESLELIEKEYKAQKATDDKYFIVAGRYAQELFIHNKKNESFNVLNENINIAKNKNDYKNAAFLLCRNSIQHFLNNNNIESSKSFENAKTYAFKTNNFEIKGYTSYTAGWLAIRKKQEIVAIKYFLEAINYYDQAFPSETLLIRKSSTYKELAYIYSGWNDFESEEKYSKKALELALEQNKPDAIFSAYMLVGHMYMSKIPEEPENQSIKGLAESYFLKAIAIFRSNNMIYPSDLTYVATSLADLYIKYYPITYLDKASEYVTLANKINIENKDPNQSASILGLFGEIELKKNNTLKAKEFFEDALKELDQSLSKNLEAELTLLDNLANITEMNKNYEEALMYKKEFLNVYKYIFDQNKIQTSKEIEAQFEKELQKKEFEKIKILAEKKEQQIQLLNVIAIQKEQEFNNLKLVKENQAKQLELSKLEALRKQHELKLIKLEREVKNKDLINFKERLSYKDQINNFYVVLIAFFVLILLLVLFLLRQRTKVMIHKEELYNLALDQEKQDNKISTLTALLKGQEKERARLARDLHDGLGSLLSATKMQLSEFNNKTTNEDKHDIINVLDHIDYAIEKLRRISHNLMPDLLMKFGLEIALKEFANRMHTNNLDIHTQFFNYKTPLTKDKELFVYRIIQELVSNAIKHAQASHIIIQVTEDFDSYHITVEDDGKGFDIENSNLSNSAGIHNIQSRIEFLKGKVNLHSEIGQGTSVEINFPKDKV